VKKAH